MATIQIARVIHLPRRPATKDASADKDYLQGEEGKGSARG